MVGAPNTLAEIRELGDHLAHPRTIGRWARLLWSAGGVLALAVGLMGMRIVARNDLQTVIDQVHQREIDANAAAVKRNEVRIAATTMRSQLRYDTLRRQHDLVMRQLEAQAALTTYNRRLLRQQAAKINRQTRRLNTMGRALGRLRRIEGKIDRLLARR